MLGLLVPTHVSWAQKAATQLDKLLCDHAHCELKAAQNALSLVGKYGGQYPLLVEPLVTLAHEETDHFGQVQKELTKRGVTLSRPLSDEYVVGLRQAARALEDLGCPLLDRLLVAALIEARSCERFKLLSEHLHERSLRDFYRELMAAEARHYRLFYDLGEMLFGLEALKPRLESLVQKEATLVAKLPLGPEIHG